MVIISFYSHGREKKLSHQANALSLLQHSSHVVQTKKMCSHSIRLRYKYLKWLEIYANIGACDVWVSAIDSNVCLEWLIFILWISQKEKKAIMIHVFEQEWSLLNMQKWARSREIWQIINWMHDLLHVHRQMKVLYLGCTLVGSYGEFKS